jgi:hypothetical protein
MGFTFQHLNNHWDRGGSSIKSAAVVYATVAPRDNLIIPEVVTAARIHFNCGQLNGVPLENEVAGVNQFYWERRFFFDDVSSKHV